MKIVALLTLALISSASMAQSPTCTGIKSDKARLACFDAAAKSQAQIADNGEKPAQAKAETKRSKEFRSGNWSVDEKLDPMTDKKTCTAIYRDDWKVQASPKDFYINLRGRGGVKSYTVRIDDEPALPMTSASDTESRISAVILRSHLDKLMLAKRLRVQVYTVLRDIVNEDVDLSGLKESVEFMRTNCEA